MDGGRIFRTLGTLLLVAAAAAAVWWRFFREAYPLPPDVARAVGLEEPVPEVVAPVEAPAPAPAPAGRLVQTADGSAAGRVVMADGTNVWIRAADGSTRVVPRHQVLDAAAAAAPAPAPAPAAAPSAAATPLPAVDAARMTDAELAEHVPIGQTRLEMADGRVVVGKVTMSDPQQYWVRLGDGLVVMVAKNKVKREVKGNGKGP